MRSAAAEAYSRAMGAWVLLGTFDFDAPEWAALGVAGAALERELAGGGSARCGDREYRLKGGKIEVLFPLSWGLADGLPTYGVMEDRYIKCEPRTPEQVAAMKERAKGVLFYPLKKGG